MGLNANLNGAAALVTGASSGLGRHFAQTLARAGARVALRRAGVSCWKRLRRTSVPPAARR